MNRKINQNALAFQDTPCQVLESMEEESVEHWGTRKIEGSLAKFSEVKSQYVQDMCGCK